MNMKKTILLIALVASTLSTYAQHQERVKALKVAFITEKLDLTSSEAEKFWPVYNNIETKKDELRKQTKRLRKSVDFESLSDSQANTVIQKMLDLENKKHQLQNKQVTDLLKVIPAKKVILLKLVEDRFNKRMLDEIKKRRQKFQNRNRP